MTQLKQRYRVTEPRRYPSQADTHIVLLFAAWFLGRSQVLIRQVVAFGVMVFAASIIGTALYVHGVLGGNRDALLLCYLVAVGIGLGYLALKRPVMWLRGWRYTR